MADITRAQARTIVETALATGRERGFKPLAIAVYDARGALKAFEAEDGTSLKRGEIAMGKAFAAVALGVPSRTINAMALERPHFVGALGGVVGGPFVPVPGGVLVKASDGSHAGAVGISGDTSDNDEAAALAGIAAAGLEGVTGA
ncbi:GlcG/HbpS family heme-binding protein [Salinarimonas sp. NSM]|uniref:GlcG/HbpS family heme-binding protein n=1 Tax=Salinarimonas sp. NSM TaxID=3458003 RepID=UPI0040356AA8